MLDGARGHKFQLHAVSMRLTIDCVVCIQSWLITTCLLEYALWGENFSKSCQTHDMFLIS
jgi:hypothetical protein